METNGALLTIMYGVKTNGAPYIIWNEVFYILNERKGSHFDGLIVTIRYDKFINMYVITFFVIAGICVFCIICCCCYKCKEEGAFEKTTTHTRSNGDVVTREVEAGIEDDLELTSAVKSFILHLFLFI